MAPKAKVLKDGVITSIDAINLVPGDVILIAIGNVIPADVKILAEEEDGSEEVPMQVRMEVGVCGPHPAHPCCRSFALQKQAAAVHQPNSH